MTSDPTSPEPTPSTPDVATVAPPTSTPVVTVARLQPDEVELTVHRTDAGVVVTRSGEPPVAAGPDVLAALRASGACALDQDQPLIITVDEEAGVGVDDVLDVVREHSVGHVPDDSSYAYQRVVDCREGLLTVNDTDYGLVALPGGGFEFFAVPVHAEPLDLLAEIGYWESGSMCGGWSHVRIGRLPSGTLVELQVLNEDPGSFRALDDSTVSDLDAVMTFLEKIEDDYTVPGQMLCYATYGLGMHVEHLADIEPDASPSLVVETWLFLRDADIDALLRRIESDDPRGVAALKELAAAQAATADDV